MKINQTIACLVATMSLFTFAARVDAADSASKKASPATTESAKPHATAKVDLNTADAATLETLPGVGAQTAKAIIAARPFKSVNELQEVTGIGPARMRDLKDRVTVSPVVAKKDVTASAGTNAAKRDTAKVTSPSRKVDINTADAATLETLPGVGPATAKAIVAARPFSSVDDLERVSGIGPAKLAELRDQVTASPHHAQTTRGATASKPAAKADSRSPSRASESERALEPTGRVDSPRSGDAGPRTTAASAGKVNLNTATLEELESLPEIGPVKAQAIINARPFSTIDDVMRVKGIKEGTFEVIKDRITVR